MLPLPPSMHMRSPGVLATLFPSVSGVSFGLAITFFVIAALQLARAALGSEPRDVSWRALAHSVAGGLALLVGLLARFAMDRRDPSLSGSGDWPPTVLLAALTIGTTATWISTLRRATDRRATAHSSDQPTLRLARVRAGFAAVAAIATIATVVALHPVG